MKKLIALILALAMMLALVACGGSSSSSSAPAKEETKTEEPAAEEPAEEPAAEEEAPAEEAATEDPYADPYAAADPYADPYANADPYADPYAQQAEEPAAEGFTPIDTDPLVIRLYNPISGATQDAGIADLKDKITTYSNGNITFDETPAGTLGAEKDTGDLLQLGEIDMTMLSIDGVDMATPNVGMSWICLPFLFDSYEAVDNDFINGWMFQRQVEAAAADGMALLAPIENGLKVIVGTGDKIESLDGFQGFTLRVPALQFHLDYYAALGAMTVSGIDQYTGMQQKTMDGIPNNPWALALFSIDEVCDWVLKLNDVYGTMYFVANQSFMDSLTDDQRTVIYAAANDASITMREGMRQIINDWLDKCEADPSIEVYEPSPEFLADVKAVAQQIWQDDAELFDPVAMDKILTEYVG